MGRIGVRLVALATVALCWAACVTGVSSAAAAGGGGGGKTIAQAPGIFKDSTMSGSLYDSAFYAGFSVAFWQAPFVKGDHVTIRTKSSGGNTPPCQILYMPGTDDGNVSATTPILDPASSTRHGTVDGQRWVATETGNYVLAMTNADIFLSGPHQCLDAPAGKPFTFTVTVAHRGSGAGREKKGRAGDKPAGGRNSASTYVVEPGQSLWMIAQRLSAEPASIAQIAFEVGRLWQLNTERIGTGNPDLIFPGQQLRLK